MATANKNPEKSSIIDIKKPFSASEDGINITEYTAGPRDGLPPVASAYAIAIEAVSKEDAEKLQAVLDELKAKADAEKAAALKAAEKKEETE